jgi:hypothetical protein
MQDNGMHAGRSTLSWPHDMLPWQTLDDPRKLSAYPHASHRRLLGTQNFTAQAHVSFYDRLAERALSFDGPNLLHIDTAPRSARCFI